MQAGRATQAGDEPASPEFHGGEDKTLSSYSARHSAFWKQQLGLLLEDDSFPAKFLQAGRLGYYLRVLQVGEIAAGDTMTLLQRGSIGVEALWRAVFSPNQRNPELASQALQRPATSNSTTRRRAVARRLVFPS